MTNGDPSMMANTFLVQAAKHLHHSLLLKWSQLPDWASFTAGVDDMWKGYRQNFATQEDQRFCIITFVHPVSGRRVYHELYGLPFGLGVV
eukprot:3024287-Amphidinium_carterae.1